MKALTEEQQRIFDAETAGLEPSQFNPSAEFLESLGFEFARYVQMANYKGEDAELEIYENAIGQKIVKLCVTQMTYTEGDLLHQSCFAPDEVLHNLENEHMKFKI